MLKRRESRIAAICLILVIVLCSIFVHKLLDDKQAAKENRSQIKIAVFGDSIIGNTRDQTSVTGVMESVLGESVFNGGFGGTCASEKNGSERNTFYEDSMSLTQMTQAFVYDDYTVQLSDQKGNRHSLAYFLESIKALKELDKDKVEVIIIEHGINDYNGSRPLDNKNDPLDRLTYGGALRYSISLLQKERPDIRIILSTPLYCYYELNGVRQDEDCTTRDYGYGTLEAYVNLEKEIAKDYGIEVVDNYHNLGLDKNNMEQYTEDGIHLNEDGRKLLGEKLASYLLAK